MRELVAKMAVVVLGPMVAVGFKASLSLVARILAATLLVSVVSIS